MKKVFPKADLVIDKWLQQSQPEGKSPKSRIFFEGDSIYSYGKHYQLAKIFKEKQIIFVNKISSSKTTGRQKNLIMSIGYNFKIYYIIDFEDHQKNVEEMKKECTKWNKKVLKAKIYTHIAFEELKISIKKLNQYIENFHLQYGKFSLSDFCTEKTYIKLITQKLLEKI